MSNVPLVGENNTWTWNPQSSLFFVHGSTMNSGTIDQSSAFFCHQLLQVVLEFY